MVGIGAEAVLGYMHPLDVHLAVLDGTIGVHEGCFALADGLDLGAEELHPRRIAVKDDVLKLRLLVQDLYVAL